MGFNDSVMAEQAGMFMVRQTVGSVLCCKCGIPMQPNAANMCVKCLCSEVNITEGLKKHMIVRHCPECNTYLQPPSTWIRAQLESKELLAFCIKQLHLPKFVRMVNAGFIWTEPHSKRIKLRLTIQKEVLSSAVVEQAFVAEFVQQETMCESCMRVQANPDQWVAAVQLRQNVSHRRTFFHLEQRILKHNAAAHAIKIKQMSQGIDFFFGIRSHAMKFVEFISKAAPVKSCNSKELVSHDTHSNNYSFKYTFSLEIPPICREDLICLPPEVAVSLGNISPIVICTNVSDRITLLDPLKPTRIYSLNGEQYRRTSFKPLRTSRELTGYIVLNIETISPKVNIGKSTYQLAEVEVARLSDFGNNDTTFHVKTHIGHVLKTGDHALGYDSCSANINNPELDKYKSLVLPEVILIRKSYEEKREKNRGKPRSWKLKSLKMEVDEPSSRHDHENTNKEYEEFLRDLEEDPELRLNISLYQNKKYQPSDMASTVDGEDVPSVPLHELLADLDLSDMDEDDRMSE